ncbi:DEAD/DEAH box helicase [Alkaliflexus imshenetskii]|uniref:DEAD/DEAH box helicase n=1 Tax=Alkaliflexus imshenetskii TaxID=286730 RepID=UPI00047C96FD|nr:DEAD/DEAH box helicase [Alkaliflexus imshenetskii]
MEQLIIVFTEKRHIGLTAIPYHASFEENQPITLHEHATLNHLSEQSGRYSDDEKSIVTLLSKISDQSLFKKYAREGTLKQFIDKLPLDGRFESLIKPYIEQKVYDAVKLLSRGTIPAYYKDSTFSNLYQSDLLHIGPMPAKPVFTFELTPEGLLYTLQIRQDYPGSEPRIFALFGREVDFLCKEPAVLKIKSRIYYFDNTDWKKFKPFIAKTTITIPERQVDVYMEDFVANCVRNHDVIAKGFQIESTSDSPGVHLAIKKDLQQMPALALHFSYHDKQFLADQKAPVFVKLIKEGTTYKFQKIVRDFEFEKKVEEILLELGLLRCGDGLFRPASGNKFSNPVATLAQLSDWINVNKYRLETLGYSLDAHVDDKEVFIGKVSLHIDTGEDNDWFEIRARVQIGEFSIAFMKFRKNLLENNPEFELPDGKLFMIPQEWFTRFSELFNYAKTDLHTIRLPRAHFQIMEQVKHGISNLASENGDKSVTFPEVTLPTGVQAKLRPYQMEGYAWLNFLLENGFGGILADDMGLGKTLQTITLLQKIYQNQPREEVPVDAGLEMTIQEAEIPKTQQLSLFDIPKIKSFNETGIPASLIVMPTSLVHNWQDEIRKFAPSLRVYAYTGNNRLKSKEIGRIFRHYHLVVTSYGILRNDIEMLRNYYFHYFILDESQYVKNPTSKIYDAVKSIESSHRLVLTGTPIENSLVDLWAQMNLVNKGLLGSLNFFKRHFVQPITRNNNEEKEAKLRKLIQPFMLRRTKENVAKDLPPIMEQVLYCDMTPEQETFYEREKSGIRNSIYKIFEHKTAEQSAIMALQALTRLRQIANHPVMVDENYKGSSGKFEQILDHLESIVAENHNVLVFSSFVKDLELIEHELNKRKLAYVKLTGATRERAKVIQEFNEQASIFLISLKAGGVGLNLTKADYVFMLNPWWNPAAEAQAINRAHRIGQTKNVFVYRFLSSGTIEEKIARLQQRKSELADVFVNNNNPLTDLSQEEILELFS